MKISSLLQFCREHPPLAILGLLVVLSIFSRLILLLSGGGAP